MPIKRQTVGARLTVFGDVRALVAALLTKDREFATRVSGLTGTAAVSVILTVIRQQPEAQFVASFMAAFTATDWSTTESLREWPPQGRAGG